MTREEAIDIIKCLAWHARPDEEDIEQAIKALEQEPTPKNDLGVECISRAEAIRVASGYCHPSNVAKELAKLPSMGRYDPYTDKFIKE